MEENISVVIADDHPTFREGLKMMLKKEKSIEFLGEAENGIKLMSLLLKVTPDVILLDITMPKMSGIEALKQISSKHTESKVIALTMHDQDYIIADVFEAGALGYLLKDAGKLEILNAIESVSNHQPYYSKTISFETIKRISAGNFNPYKYRKYNLSDIDKRIIVCICQEMTSKEIASTLFLSIHTVDSYRKEISKKIGVKSMAGVVIFAIKQGLYKL